ncbi:MAG TPA: hypothetical protein EYP33_06530 [Pyrodictium sp.]|nr:hypothetical protein [Pyrodictium sp.]
MVFYWGSACLGPLTKLKTLILVRKPNSMGPCEEKLLVLLREVSMWSDSPEKHEVVAFIETRLANIESYKGNYSKAFAYISEALNYAK